MNSEFADKEALEKIASQRRINNLTYGRKCSSSHNEKEEFVMQSYSLSPRSM
jgi:hypothetical protein